MPVAARQFPIEWKAVNLLHLTDVHSFIAGNRHEGIDSDYGDLLSFIGHMHDLADERGVDLFVVNTGDIVDGTGMSDATPIAGEFLTPILQMIPYDAMTIGNHELYEDATVENLALPGGFLEHFGDRCVTSNQLFDEPREPLSARFSVIEGVNGARLLTFGFLYDFRDYCPKCHVADVEIVVQEPWLANAVAQYAAEVDGIVILAHMGFDNTAVELIRAAIRAAQPPALQVPLVFLAGHTHIRTFARLDDNAAVLESGRCATLVSPAIMLVPCLLAAPLMLTRA